MIRWCAWCLRWQGEAPPFERYAMTHTMCEECLELHEEHGSGGPRFPAMEAFYERLRGEPSTRRADPSALFSEAMTIGVRPVDFLLGVLQPSLYEVGERWSRGELTVADQHHFSLVCDELAALALARLGRPRGPRPGAPVLLVRSPSNRHTFGLDLVHGLLLSAGMGSVLLEEELHALAPILDAVEQLRPRILGISVTLADDGLAVHRLAGEVERRLTDPPRLVVGGLGVKLGHTSPLPAVPSFTDARAFVHFAGGVLEAPDVLSPPGDEPAAPAPPGRSPPVPPRPRG